MIGNDPREAIELTKNLGLLKDEQLAAMLQDPMSAAPAFMVLDELKKRKIARAGAQGMQQPQHSMKDELLAGLGSKPPMPMQPPPQMPPPQGLGGPPMGGPPMGGPPVKMAQGGIVHFQRGHGVTGSWADPNEQEESWLTNALNYIPNETRWSEGYSQATPRGIWDRFWSWTKGPSTGGATGSWGEPDKPAAAKKEEDAGITKVDASASGRRGGGGGGMPNIPGYTPQNQEYYMGKLGMYPTRNVPTLESSMQKGAELQKTQGFDFSQLERSQAERLADLMTTKKENRDMALLQAGLGIMGGQSTNAWANIGKGATQGTEFLAKARDAERAEMQAIRDGDMKLAQSKHQEKLQYQQMAQVHAGQESQAQYEANLGKYQQGATALGFERGDTALARQHGLDIAKLQLQAQRNAIAAEAVRQRAAGIGSNMKVDQKAVEGEAKRIMEYFTNLEAQSKSQTIDSKSHASLRKWLAIPPEKRGAIAYQQAAQNVLSAAGMTYNTKDPSSVNPKAGITADWSGDDDDDDESP